MTKDKLHDTNNYKKKLNKKYLRIFGHFWLLNFWYRVLLPAHVKGFSVSQMKDILVILVFLVCLYQEKEKSISNFNINVCDQQK